MTEPLHVRGSSLEWKSTRPGIGRIALGDDAATGAQTLLFKVRTRRLLSRARPPDRRGHLGARRRHADRRLLVDEGRLLPHASGRPEFERLEERLRRARGYLAWLDCLSRPGHARSRPGNRNAGGEAECSTHVPNVTLNRRESVT
jgi:hypothetical protein